VKKALLGLALLGVAIAQDLRMPVENAIPSFTPQQQTGSLSELERKIITVCNMFSKYVGEVCHGGGESGYGCSTYTGYNAFDVNRCITSLQTRGYYLAGGKVYGAVYDYRGRWWWGLYDIDRLYVSGNDVVGCIWHYKYNYCIYTVRLF